MPKQSGGLGVLNLKTQNEALLLKFLHKFYNKMDIPWVYLTWKSDYSKKIPHATDPVGSFWWRDVAKLMPVYRGISTIQVANGRNVLFWKDSWDDNIIADKYPRAFSYTINEDISVNDFLSITTLCEAFHLPLSE